MTFAFIAEHGGIWLVAWMCDGLGASRSSLHAWSMKADATPHWRWTR